MASKDAAHFFYLGSPPSPRRGNEQIIFELTNPELTNPELTNPKLTNPELTNPQKSPPSPQKGERKIVILIIMSKDKSLLNFKH